MRDHLWHRDPNLRLAAIRPQSGNEAAYPDGKTFDKWGGMEARSFATGESALLNIGTRIEDQVDWLQRYDPDYILIYPANIQAIAIHCERHQIRFPSLKQVHTMADLLRPEVRTVCREALGVPVVDIYSSAVIGYIALQCPESENLHIQSEYVFVEVLNDAGMPCKPGEVGQVVTTPLHNFAMPLIRYAVGDFAEVGSFSCGRTLPVLSQIMGRARSMVRLPNGDLFYVNFLHLVKGFEVIRQFQIVRTASEALEMKLVAKRNLNAEEEAGLTQILHECFRHPFTIFFTYHDEIPRSASGKFEDYKDETEPV